MLDLLSCSVLLMGNKQDKVKTLVCLEFSVYYMHAIKVICQNGLVYELFVAGIVGLFLDLLNALFYFSLVKSLFWQNRALILQVLEECVYIDSFCI